METTLPFDPVDGEQVVIRLLTLARERLEFLRHGVERVRQPLGLDHEGTRSEDLDLDGLHISHLLAAPRPALPRRAVPGHARPRSATRSATPNDATPSLGCVGSYARARFARMASASAIAAGDPARRSRAIPDARRTASLSVPIASTIPASSAGFAVTMRPWPKPFRTFSTPVRRPFATSA